MKDATVDESYCGVVFTSREEGERICIREKPCPVHSKPKDPAEIEGRAWNLIEACEDADVEPYGWVGEAIEQLREALNRVE
jgi:hypothetical protein